MAVPSRLALLPSAALARQAAPSLAPELGENVLKF